MTLREINDLIDEGDSLKLIAQSYSEIANQKIKKIRSLVERNRRFFEEISFVYGIVRTSAEKKKLTLLKPKKRIALIITSNSGFYGEINIDLIDFFNRTMTKSDADIILVGKAAIDYFQHNPKYQRAGEVILRDDQPDAIELNNLVKIIKDYRQVLVFYSKMKTVLVQNPSVIDLSRSSLTETSNQQLDFKLLFEPDLAKMLEFFDNQVLTLLMEATFLESDLARTASRFISMDSAETEANKLIKSYLRQKAYFNRNMQNNQILESLAAIAALRKI